MKKNMLYDKEVYEIQLQIFFVSLRDGSKSRFVSAAGDETRQGETELDAPLKAKP